MIGYWSFLMLSGALYLASLFNTAFTCVSQHATQPCYMYGWAALVYGWLTLLTAFEDRAFIAWCANPALWASWTFAFLSRRLAIPLTVLALALALSFLTAKAVQGGFSPPSPVIDVGLGYWLWLASMGSALAAVLSGHPTLLRPAER